MTQKYLLRSVSNLISDIRSLIDDHTALSSNKYSPVAFEALYSKEEKRPQDPKFGFQSSPIGISSNNASLAVDELSARNIDLAQENNLLLMQLKILKEDLSNVIREGAEQKKAQAALENRLSRIQRLLPDAFEHGLLEIMDVVKDGDSQTVTCRFTDFKLKDLVDSEFIFQLVFSSQGIGIWVDPEPGPSRFFYPKQVSLDQQRNLYFSYTAQQWKRVLTAISGCLHYFATRPKYFSSPQSFDANAWLGLITKLSEQVLSLPAMPRFDSVALKREQTNEDYEYIWFEIFNLTYEDFSCPKFEVRFSASLVKTDGFSRFPKIEIPLVDGIHKPFTSWYAESADDLGDKFEIRFALDNHSFDLKVWNQLSSEDKSILTLLILYFPQILGRLSLDAELTGRKWDDWMALANQTTDVFKSFLTGKSQFAAALKDDGIKTKVISKGSQVKSFSVRPKNRS